MKGVFEWLHLSLKLLIKMLLGDSQRGSRVKKYLLKLKALKDEPLSSSGSIFNASLVN